jgi:hypothetical protein
MPTFTGRDILRDVETETAEVPEGARLAPVILCFYGVGTILYHLKAVTVGDRQDRIHVAWPTRKMDWENGARGASLCTPRCRPGLCFSVWGSMSARTGIAPAWMIELTVAQKVRGGCDDFITWIKSGGQSC